MKEEREHARSKRLDQREIGRRVFLASASSAAAGGLLKASGNRESSPIQAGSGSSSGALAVDGGKPVRSSRLLVKLSGPQYYDEEEKRELLEVWERRSPFRWWGIDANAPKPEKCARFEMELADHQQTKYCVAVTSGTTALMTALAALEVGPGDEVILPAWTFSACYDAILTTGALPVFAEIDDSMNIDPSDLEHRITPRTKVIMAVHILGAPADLDRVLPIARKHDIRVLEDCAQSAGVSYKGRPVGSMGDCGIFSFQVNKTISAGDGGAFVTSDPVLFERASRFHDHGILRDGHAQVLNQPSRVSTFSSPHFRMNEFTAAVMRAQLRKLDRIVADFRSRRDRLLQGIADLPGIEFRKMYDATGALGNWIFFKSSGKSQRDRFIQAIRAENIQASAMAGSSILPTDEHIAKKHTLRKDWPSFMVGRGASIMYGIEACPRTTDLYNRFVGIPVDPKFTEQDLTDIVTAVRKVYLALIHV